MEEEIMEFALPRLAGYLHNVPPVKVRSALILLLDDLDTAGYKIGKFCAKPLTNNSGEG